MHADINKQHVHGYGSLRTATGIDCISFCVRKDNLAHRLLEYMFVVCYFAVVPL